MRAKHLATILLLRTLATIAIGVGIALIIETCRLWIMSDMPDMIGAYSQVGVTSLTLGQRYANAALGLVANSFVFALLAGLAMAMLEHSGRGRARKLARGYLLAGASGAGYVVYGILAVPIKDIVMTWGTDLTAIPMRFAPIETVYGIGAISLVLLTMGSTTFLLARYQQRKENP